MRQLTETAEAAVTCETDKTAERGVSQKTNVTRRFTKSVLLLIVLSLTTLRSLARPSCRGVIARSISVGCREVFVSFSETDNLNNNLLFAVPRVTAL